jgi:phage-related tail fiber protein
LSTSGVNAGTYSSVTVDAKGRVTGGTNPTTISANTTGNAATATTAAACAGNAVTATKLQTLRTINGVAFDGSVNINITSANGGTIATTQQVNALSKSRMQFFTASGTFTVPIGVTSVYVTLSGAGGGGGGGNHNRPGSGGGFGQYVARFPISELTSETVINVTVGCGGSGGAGVGGSSHSEDGTPGGSSSFGSYASVIGGGGGAGSWGVENQSMGGTTYYRELTSTSSGATVTKGFDGTTNSVASSYGGIGGIGLIGVCFTRGGNGGNSGDISRVGSPGTDGGLYGSGGGGGGAGSGIYKYNLSGGNGGAGAPGFVLVEW